MFYVEHIEGVGDKCGNSASLVSGTGKVEFYGCGRVTGAVGF